MPGNKNIGPLEEYLMLENSAIREQLVRHQRGSQMCRRLFNDTLVQMREAHERLEDRLADSDDINASYRERLTIWRARHESLLLYVMQLEQRLARFDPSTRMLAGIMSRAAGTYEVFLHSEEEISETEMGEGEDERQLSDGEL